MKQLERARRVARPRALTDRLHEEGKSSRSLRFSLSGPLGPLSPCCRHLLEKFFQLRAHDAISTRILSDLSQSREIPCSACGPSGLLVGDCWCAPAPQIPKDVERHSCV